MFLYDMPPDFEELRKLYHGHTDEELADAHRRLMAYLHAMIEIAGDEGGKRHQR